MICDTDITVIRIWWEERFGRFPASLEHAMAARGPRCYLLARPDLPWQPDPLRENPTDRERLYERYLSLLQDGPFAFRVVSGQGPDRIHCALSGWREMTERPLARS